jgi:hypothetical protein
MLVAGSRRRLNGNIHRALIQRNTRNKHIIHIFISTFTIQKQLFIQLKLHMRRYLCFLFLLCIMPFHDLSAQVDTHYNVTWTSPSKSSLGSMPLSGRHGAGANVWVQDGSLWIYLDHNGAYDECGRLLKLGCLRMTPHHSALGGRGFKQTLDLASGAIDISQADIHITLRFADEALIIKSHSKSPDTFDISFGSWRYKPLQNVRIDMFNARGSYSPDSITMSKTGFLWCHNNAASPYDVEALAKQQGIAVNNVGSVTAKRIFGGAIVVQGGLTNLKSSLVRWQYWDGKTWTGSSHLSKEQTIIVRMGAGIGVRPTDWEKEATALLRPSALSKALQQEQLLWNEFWSRSFVNINDKAGEKDNGFLIGRNYQLFRYMLACNRDGELPLLFNGGIFTVDNKPGEVTGNNNNELPISEGDSITPDFRRWMYCHFMSQNQRWLGWPTIANGDEELLSPSIHFYRDRSAVAAARAHENGAQGVVYPEPLDVWGLCCVAPLKNGLCGADHLTYHFSMMLENAWMALQAHSVLNRDISKDMSWIEGTVKFYDTYYRLKHKELTGHELGDDGKLVIYPGNGLELAKGATNQIEAVCALRRITGALLSLPGLPDSVRKDMQRISSILPDVPIGIRNGKRSLLPAKSWEQEYNKWEPIEMYAFWPYRVVGVTKPETLQLARDTWNTVPEDRARLCKQDYSWMANVVNMAALAWPEEAKKRAIYKMANNTAPQMRFPAFFGPGHDWLPDHNWGGSGMTGIQEMLMAADPYGDGKIYLLYAWPKEWNVHFKLHAPQNTVVEADVVNGKVAQLKVTPSERTKDVMVCPTFK